MRPSEALKFYREDILKIVKDHHAHNARVFGSTLYGNDTEESDLDILVEPTNQTSLLDIAKMQNRLQKLLKIHVDVLTPKALPENFRNIVLLEAKQI